MPYRTKDGELKQFPHEVECSAIVKTPQYTGFRLEQEAIRKAERSARYRHYLDCIRRNARQRRHGRVRRKFFQKQVDAVMHAIDMGRDPYEMLVTTPQLNEVDRMGNPVDTREHYGRTPEAQAGANLASIYSSRQFSDAVQKRSNRAGEIIDVCMDGLEWQARQFNKERQENPGVQDRDAVVTTKTFNKVSSMLFGFYQNTQSTLVRHVALNRGVTDGEDESDLSSMTEQQLLDIVTRPLDTGGAEAGKEIEAEAVVSDDGEQTSDEVSVVRDGEDCPSSGGCTGSASTAGTEAPNPPNEADSAQAEGPGTTAALDPCGVNIVHSNAVGAENG